MPSQAPAGITQAAAVSVEQAVRNALTAGETPAVLVKFRGKADLSSAFGMTERNARATYVYETLRDFATARQASVVQTLASQYSLSEAAHEYTVLWIDNSIAIARLSAPMLSSLEADPNVESVRVQKEIPLPQEPVTETAPWQLNDAVSSLAHIKVPEVWALGHKGAGVVVANIDAGVRYTHQALVGKYRGNLGSGSFDHNYNWYDPYNHSAAPRYSDPHGSHTMGTMVGDGGTSTTQTGAAPDAKWVACIGFGLSGAGATDAGLLECGQWALAPYPTAGGGTPDPTKHPDIVNNSWGDCGRSYDDWYEGVIDGWIAAGIVPVFSNGNASNCGYPSNPPLNTVGNPGRSGKVLGIGSTGTTNGLYASHSNKGTTDNPNPGLPNYPDPAGFPNLKPNVVAPGVSIRSSGSSSDSNYYNETGTSMSAPTASGVIALMWSAAECLRGDYATTGTLLMSTANPVPVATGSPSDGPGNVPNQATGWGEIDALAAVNASIQHCAAGAVPSVTKDFAPALISNGASSTLTIHLSNPAASEATLTAALTDTFPANLVVASTPAASTTCTSGTVTATAGAGSVSLGSGAKIPASGACTVTVSVTSTVNGSYDNVIAAGALQTDAGNSTAEATATLTVNASGLNPPTLAKAFAPTSISEGGTSTLTITLSNDNASALTLSGDLVDTFPNGLVVATAPNASTTCGGAVTAAAGGGSVTLAGSGSSIPASGSCTVKVDVSSAAAASYTNTIPAGALQTSAGSNAADASATLTVTSAAGVVCSNPINHTIATDLDGSYFGWVSGQVSDDTFSGWNFNPYGSSGSFAFFWNSSGGDAGVAATDGQRDWLVLQNGAVVGPSSTFSSATGVATNWSAGVDGYLGFKFTCAAGTCYGYAHMTSTGTTGFPATLIDYCYDSAGNAITITGGTPLNDPAATVSPTSLSFTVASNATATEQVNIANAAGSSALTYSIEAREAAKAVLYPHTSRIDRNRLSKAGASNPDREAKLAELKARKPSTLAVGGRRGGSTTPWAPQG
ncbi:S8 family serine peptidase, partial [Dokdonella ginsengisoli]